MKHAEVLAIPVGSKIVVSERASELHRANMTNSVIAVLESHANFQKPHWSGLYWRAMSDASSLWTPTDPKSRTKRYYITTTMTKQDGSVEKVKTLVDGQTILGVYDTTTQKLWDDYAKAKEDQDAEDARTRSIIQEAEERGRREAESRTTSVRDTVEGLLGRKFDPADREINIHIRQDSHRWLDEQRTKADPTLSGSVSLDYKLFEELVEKMYAQLDAR
jgi:hypothetical protein